jgi:succinoglycan biosynthesis transport protein ExoP
MNGPTFAPATTPEPPAAAAPKPAPPRPAARATTRPDPDAAGGLRVLTYLRLHWLMIAFCGTLLGAVGAYAAWELLPSKYESYALFQVSAVPSSLAGVGNRDQARTEFSTYVKTTAALIKSEFVLNAALRDIKDLPTIKDQKEPIKFLDEEIQVNWQDGSEVIRITFKGHAPADARRIVDAIQKAFVAEVVQKDVREKEDFLKKIKDAKVEIRRLLEDKAPKPLPKGVTGGVVNAGGPAPAEGEPQPASATQPPAPVAPLAGNPSDPPAPAAALPPGLTTRELLGKYDPKIVVANVASLVTEVERLPLQINDAKRRLMVIEAEARGLQDAPPDPASVAAVEKEPEVILHAQKVEAARRDYAFWSSAGRATSPAAQDYKRVLEDRQATLARVKQEKLRAIEGARRMKEVEKLRSEANAVLRELRKLEEQFNTAKAMLDRAEKQLAELPPPAEKISADGRIDREGHYDAARTDLMTTDSILARLIQQEHLTQLELNSPQRVKVLQPASSPTQKDIRKQVLATVFAGLMGYVLIALGVVAYETVGRRVSSLADLRAAGPTPVVGVIPGQPGEAVGRDPAKRAAANEAIDKLRGYVAQTWLARGATTVAVTSPLGDEGKAFAAFGLASSLAQAGYKTLLVDFDLRDPALHTYAGVQNQNGVCELLRGEADARAAVQSLPSGLHLVPAGRWSDEARKAAVGGKLEALLSRLKEPYDVVVLHGHALLTAAESVEVARRCEAVLVCARYRETRTPLLKKATERVAAMEIPYAGVVYVGATEHEALC